MTSVPQVRQALQDALARPVTEAIQAARASQVLAACQDCPDLQEIPGREVCVNVMHSHCLELTKGWGIKLTGLQDFAYFLCRDHFRLQKSIDPYVVVIKLMKVRVHGC